MEEQQHLVDEIKRKEAEIIVTLQDIAEVALTEEAKEPAAAGEEDDNQVDSDLSKVANEIAMTSGNPMDSNSETDLDDDIVDDAVEIKDTRPVVEDLSFLWAPKVTEVCVPKAVEDDVKETKDVNKNTDLPELEDEFEVEEVKARMENGHIENGKTPKGPTPTFQHRFEQSVLDATGKSPIVMDVIPVPRDNAIETNEDVEDDEDKEIETAMQNGKDDTEESEEETEPIIESKEAEKETVEIAEEGGDDSGSWKIDFIRVETESKTAQKNKKAVVKNEKWNVSKTRKEKQNKRKKDKRREKRREAQPALQQSETVKSSRITLNLTAAPAPAPPPRREEVARKVVEVEDWSRVVEVGPAWEQEVTRSLLLEDSKEARYSPMVPRGTSDRSVQGAGCRVQGAGWGKDHALAATSAHAPGVWRPCQPATSRCSPARPAPTPSSCPHPSSR